MISENSKGSTLVEAVVALVAILITLSAITIAVVVAVNNSTFVKNQNLAAKYAQEGIEYLRNAKLNNDSVNIDGQDKQFSEVSVGEYCFDENNLLLMKAENTCIVNISTLFKRSLAITTDNASCGGMKMRITVKWTSGKCSDPNNRFCHKSEVTSCFPNKPLQNP